MSQPIVKRIGATLGILGEFRDSSKNLVDPATVTAGYIDPDGAVGSLTTARPTASPWNIAGYSYAQVDSTKTGRWVLWMKGDDTFDDVQILEFTVLALS